MLLVFSEILHSRPCSLWTGELWIRINFTSFFEILHSLFFVNWWIANQNQCYLFSLKSLIPCSLWTCELWIIINFSSFFEICHSLISVTWGIVNQPKCYLLPLKSDIPCSLNWWIVNQNQLCLVFWIPSFFVFCELVNWESVHISIVFSKIFHSMFSLNWWLRIRTYINYFLWDISFHEMKFTEIKDWRILEKEAKLILIHNSSVQRERGMKDFRENN